MDAATTAQTKRNRGDKGLDDLVNKLARLGDGEGAKTKAKARGEAPKDMAGVEDANANARENANAAVLDTERASEKFQNAVEELNEQTAKFAKILTLITDFERTVDGFLSTMKKDHQIGLYAHSIMEQNISLLLSSDIRSLRDTVKRMSAFPGQLAEQIRAFPEKVRLGIEGVQFYSKPEQYAKLQSAERARYFSHFAQGTYLSPAGLLIKAIGSPTLLGKTDPKSKRDVLTKIHSFKRMFPSYAFARLEMEFIREWLTTGRVVFGFNNAHERKFTAEEEQTPYLPLLMNLFGKDAVHYFGEESGLQKGGRGKGRGARKKILSAI